MESLSFLTTLLGKKAILMETNTNSLKLTGVQVLDVDKLEVIYFVIPDISQPNECLLDEVGKLDLSKKITKKQFYDTIKSGTKINYCLSCCSDPLVEFLKYQHGIEREGKHCELQNSLNYFSCPWLIRQDIKFKLIGLSEIFTGVSNLKEDNVLLEVIDLDSLLPIYFSVPFNEDSCKLLSQDGRLKTNVSLTDDQFFELVKKGIKVIHLFHTERFPLILLKQELHEFSSNSI